VTNWHGASYDSARRPGQFPYIACMILLIEYNGLVVVTMTTDLDWTDSDWYTRTLAASAFS